MAQRLNFLLITLCFLVFSFFILFSFSCKKKSSSPISYTNKTQVFEKIKSRGVLDYTGIIQNLSKSGKKAGKKWLSEIALSVRNVYKAGENKRG